MSRLVKTGAEGGEPCTDVVEIHRPQHLKQIANGLPADDPARVAARPLIVEEVERLHWRI